VIVHYHGGPEGQSRPGFGRVGQMLALAGFVFVEPNVRGSLGYGRSYTRADDGAKRLDVIGDIEDCARYIRANWGKDGKAPRLGVMGGSYGGYATLMAMSRYAGAYDVGVSSVGMSNLRTFLLNTAPYRRLLRISEYGDPDKDKEALEKLSPTSYLENVRGPLMILQGVGDPRVPAGESIQMHDLLEKRGVKAKLILFASEGHGSAKRENQVLQYGHMLKFFQDNLLK
jgi:dipeptidyl aminopeptidase/acylaminoacyl peptidase